jgi:hypothetical protein
MKSLFFSMFVIGVCVAYWIGHSLGRVQGFEEAKTQASAMKIFDSTPAPTFSASSNPKIPEVPTRQSPPTEASRRDDLIQDAVAPPAVPKAVEAKPVEKKAKSDGAPIDKSPEAQSERLQIIQSVIASGGWKQPEKRNDHLVRVAVTPSFLSLDFDTKNSLISCVFAYYFDTSSSKNYIILESSKSGNDVGRFSALHGGLKMY